MYTRFSADSFCLQWEGSFYCTGCAAECGIFTAQNGTISDGSGSSNYPDLSSCGWMIAPPTASAISLTFTELSVEAGYDFVRVWQCNNIACTTGKQVAELSGSYSTPQIVRVATGLMIIALSSDNYGTGDGFKASWVSVCTHAPPLLDPLLQALQARERTIEMIAIPIFIMQCETVCCCVILAHQTCV